MKSNFYSFFVFHPSNLAVLMLFSDICWIFTVQVPTIETTSTSVVGVISESLGKRRIVDSGPSATAVAIFLALGTAFRFPETDPAHVESSAVRTAWLDHPLVGTATASIIGIITERSRPWEACTLAGTRASHSLTLWAAFGLSILCILECSPSFRFFIDTRIRELCCLCRFWMALTKRGWSSNHCRCTLVLGTDYSSQFPRSKS